MAARKRRILLRTIAVSRIRKGRVYFWRAAWRTSSKSRLTSACVSNTASCGCCGTACLVLTKLLRSPIKVSPRDHELSFGNVTYDDVVGGTRVPFACHDDLLLRVESKKKKT